MAAVKAVKDELLHLGRTILHAYFEETNLGPFLAHLAPDVIWLGAGQEMRAEGRTAVTAIFEKGQDQLITDPLTRTDLDLVGIFVQSLLEQPSPSLEKHLERMNSLPDYPSLQGMRQSTRHRLQLTMGRYQLLLLSTRPQDAVPSPTSSQMCRCYDAIVQIAALEHTGLGEEAGALLRSTLAEALEDKLYLPFVEHQSLLGPMLVKAVQQPEFADFLQVVQSYSLTPAKGRPLKEEVFSAREKLVIQRVKEGRSNKEIAQEVNVAEITIKKQLSLLYHRFQVKNRTQLLHAVEKM